MTPIASVSNLTVRYGAKIVLSDFSLAIPEGCVGLLGPNGAGKTTLLKTLMGFVPPAGGTGTVFGHNVATESLKIRQRIGLMPEQDCHIPGMNAVSFVAYAGELAGMPADQALRRAHEVLEYCALGEARYREVDTYSTGMKQRIKLAQALIHGPKLLFLDEPTNGLDPQGRDDMLALIRDISHGKGLSVVVSSHLLPDIEKTCDHVIVMKTGRVVVEGGIDSLRKTEGARCDVELRVYDPAFETSLKTHGGTLIGRQGSRCQVSFEREAGMATRIWQAARDAGVQVRGIRPLHRTLEDVFLEAVA